MPKAFLRLSLKCWYFVLAIFAGALPVRAESQVHALPQVDAPAQARAVDPLGRETPRGTLMGFIRAAQYGYYDSATQYFQPRRRSSGEADKELAAQLLAILNAGFAGSLDSIPNDPQGRLGDGLPHEQVMIGGTHAVSESFAVYLVHTEDARGVKLWLISRQTLDEVPEMYDSLRFPQLERELPKFFVKDRLSGMPLWQWIAIVLFLPIAGLLGWVATSLISASHQLIRRRRGLPPPAPRRLRRFGISAVVIAILFHYYFVYFIGASILYRQYYQRAIWVVLAFALYWMITRITYWISVRIWNNLTDKNLIAERSLISLMRRALDVAIFVAIGLVVLDKLDANVPAALAGLGIGGLAIGLGAQKTFENLLGGISILTDKAIVVGDPCKIGDQRGVVEDIGLRSTKLRTEERTLVSIPNGTVSTAILENYRWRDKILCKQMVRLRYDLSPDQLRFVLEQLRKVLSSHPKVEQGTARVRLLKLGEYAMEVEMYGYLLVGTYAEYLAVQEELILQVMDTLERTGAAVALSSQTTLVTREQSVVDPDKAARAQRAVEKTRDPGVPGGHRPELEPDAIPREALNS